MSFYSDPSTAAYAALGLTDFLPAYVWSRSSVLGVADAAVVVAAFGVWEPGLIRTNVDIGRRACSLRDIRAATRNGAGEAARQVLDGIDEHTVMDVVTVLRRGIDAADVAARPLFAGHRAGAWPADPCVGLWHAATAWRELQATRTWRPAWPRDCLASRPTSSTNCTRATHSMSTPPPATGRPTTSRRPRACSVDEGC